MVIQAQTASIVDVIYPDSDGQPMAENTKQFNWIVTIKENLELFFAADPKVFVAGDLLWYPVEGSNTIRLAPDAMVVFGRPKGDRGSYQQWREDGIPPQVVFEILSPGNRLSEMSRKFRFYEQYGVEEYYLYDPDRVDFAVWIREADRLVEIATPENWTSPLLGIRFQLQVDTLVIYRPDGQVFSSFVEVNQRLQQANRQLQQANQQLQQVELEAEQARRQNDQLAAKLRELGIDPTQL